MRTERRKAFVACLGIAAFIAFEAAAPQAKWKGTVIKEGDVTVVKNPKEPLY
ncbi:MAG: hypothetical protein H6P95_2315, partial [Candidatus Aminicenantes bacterium]|nr:hypothetical protein [Candidatus Aminicenantes bacterium]